MDLIVIKKFRDKETKKVYSPKDVISHFDDARAKDVIERDLAKAKEEAPATDIDLSLAAQKVIACVQTFTDVEKLKGYLQQENSSEKPRKTVVEAIESRLSELIL
jgi:hypothetical protein